MAELQPHPLAERYPLMVGGEYEAFKADIDANGLLNPIWLFEGKILDGRNRYRACRELGREPAFLQYTGDDPAGFVVSQNEHRRHLTPEFRKQRVAEMRAQGMSLRKIAEEMGIDKRQVQRDLGTVSPPDPPPEPVTPAAPPPAPPKVTGKDGKRYPAAGRARVEPSPDRTAEMLTMRAAGKSFREIGEAMGVSPVTVKTTIHRAAKRAAAGPPQPPPAAPPPAPSHQESPNPTRPAWAEVASLLSRVAGLIESAGPVHDEEIEPWDLVKSLESTASVLIRRARDIRRRHHL